MGFRKPNLDPAYGSIGQSLIEISSPYNDGWTASSCKYELYRLKCYLDDAYAQLPTFANEAEWEKERLVEVLTK
jgi:hypothetical protein